MREAIGNTFIVNLVAIFLAVMIALLFGSISYSKAFKVKNRIVYIIEKYNGWDDGALNNYAREEVEAALKEIGYQLILANRSCPYRSGGTVVYGDRSSDTYRYCIYEYDNEKGHYYGVATFMHFDIPLIGQWLEFPVYGETRSIYDVKTHYNN